MTRQLEAWQGESGTAYTERNVIDWRIRLPAFRQMLEGLPILRVLEVGCNRGHNLLALAEVVGQVPERSGVDSHATSEIVGIDPNRDALEAARAASPPWTARPLRFATGTGVSHRQGRRPDGPQGRLVAALQGHALEIPFKDGYFDLAFTAGVLIHIPVTDLPLALTEICRVSRRYVLAIEYFSEEETVIPYRGHTDLLWKRNFLEHYRAHCPELALNRSGYWGPESGFDQTHWWLLEKGRD